MTALDCPKCKAPHTMTETFRALPDGSRWMFCNSCGQTSLVDKDGNLLRR